MFELTDYPDRNHPNHVCVVSWIDGALSILAQAPINEETDKRVLFFDHVDGQVPAHEALGLARHIAKRFYENSNPATSGLTVMV